VAQRTILGRPIAHIGYVVGSIAEAVGFWSRAFGAGPFYLLEHVVFDDVRHGDEAIAFDHSTAFGQWGEIAVEFWQIHRLEPAEPLGPRFAPLGRLNHVAYFVDDVAAESARLARLGLPSILQITMGEVEERVHDAPPLGHVIEIQKDAELSRRFFAGLAEQAGAWDGSEPLRRARDLVPDLAQ
jgi:catechol 2,3-dioxygenase-like lactoylglutathione lyase family enzyme